MARPEVDKYFASIGGMGGGSSLNTGFVFVTLKERKERGLVKSQSDAANLYRKELKELVQGRVMIQELSMSGFGGSRGLPISMNLRGPDYSRLAEYSQTLKAELEKTGLFTDIDTDYDPGLPEIVVIPNRSKANLRGISVNEIDQAVGTLFGGVIAGKYSSAGRRLDIRVQLRPEDKNNLQTLKIIQLRNNRGELVPLSEVAEITERPSLKSISRVDRERSIGIYATNAKDVAVQDAQEAASTIAKKVLGPEYRVVWTGNSQNAQEMSKGILFALLLGVVVAYMILGSQFNSFIHPLTVLVALPFSLSGALLALWVFGQTLNIYSMIGLVLLMGIVKKNSILLVDYTNQLRSTHSLNSLKALLEACPTRLRPILMTSVSTIAGALPAAVSFGPGSESRIPMAISIIGGVIFSTVLTLLVVPPVYLLLSRLERGTHEHNTGQPNSA
jgi:HAE1 family hydrophobic/amphiphilic exporter-1